MRGASRVIGLLMVLLVPASLARAQAEAEALLARHAQLAPALDRNAFGRPIQVASVQEGDTLRGEVHAVLAHPFGRVRATLRPPGRWCDILVLPFNTLGCREAAGPSPGGGPVLELRVGRRPDQPPREAFPLRLAMRTVADRADYLEARLEQGRAAISRWAGKA